MENENKVLSEEEVKRLCETAGTLKDVASRLIYSSLSGKIKNSLEELCRILIKEISEFND